MKAVYLAVVLSVSLALWVGSTTAGVIIDLFSKHIASALKEPTK